MTYGKRYNISQLQQIIYNFNFNAAIFNSSLVS
jgi:hypothetical protein